MTEDKKFKQPAAPSQSPQTALSKIFARVVQTENKEIQEEINKILQQDEEAKKYVEERKGSIRRGARRERKTFRF